MRTLFCFILLLSFTIAFPRINLHLTNRFDYKYHCIQIVVPIDGFQEILSLCLTESLFKWNNQSNTIDQQFTFDELRKKNITSEQLYQWSAPIDLIEDYLTPMSENIFYNCSKPRFGPQCQYEFIDIPSENRTLSEIIVDFYREIDFLPLLTCYKHLECNRSPQSICLDWTEICDGYVNCVNDQIDEKFCWLMRLNECEEDEYRCSNGQCISKQFFLGNQKLIFECLDQIEPISISDNYSSLPILYVKDTRCPEDRRLMISNPHMTSSCDTLRQFYATQLTDNIMSKTLSNICSITFYCTFFIEKYPELICQDVCEQDRCKLFLNETCPEIIFTTNLPLAFGHVYIGFIAKSNDYSFFRIPDYICYDENLCGDFQYPNATLRIYNNKTCRLTKQTSIKFSPIMGEALTYWMHVHSVLTQLRHCHIISYHDFNLSIINSRFFYHCQNSSKYISVYQLCNGGIDCNYGDDENCILNNGICSPMESDALFKCPHKGVCISINKVGDNMCECQIYQNGRLHKCEDESSSACDPNHLDQCGSLARENYKKTLISFPRFCNGFVEIDSIDINGTIYNDENECEYWKCNNTYTRCDGVWNCLNGADEVGCIVQYPVMNCPLNQHVCVKLETFDFICLSLDKVNDGIIDCVGAIDEVNKCQRKDSKENNDYFYCDSINNTRCQHVTYLCQSNCIKQNQDLFCNRSNKLDYSYYCSRKIYQTDSDLVKYYCSHFGQLKEQLYFSLDSSINEEQKQKKILKNLKKETFEYDGRCHDGYPLRYWIDLKQKLSQIICLCPSSYYGEYCQYQNQRLSFTLQFQTYSDSRQTLFSIIIQLIDNTTQQTIHSWKQIIFNYIKHCSIKFNFYLTYSTRPKDLTKTYSIHIDIYDKLKLEYRGSLFIPLKFTFLPVYRISYVLTIPRSFQSMIIDCPKNQLCIHGQCMKYAENSNDYTFCHCKTGWTGKDCSIAYDCSCSLGSLCIGIDVYNRSICICPPNRWGPRCYLQNRICQLNGTSPCLNNGQCFLNDDNMISEMFFCICRKGFSGDRCEIEDAKIILSFDQNLISSDVIFVHFIEIRANRPIRNGSTYQSILLHQNEIIIRWTQPFHIVFVELSNKTYFLIDIQKDYNQSRIIQKFIKSSDRCGNMSEYLNETIINYPLIRRMKYYHIPCENTNLCFYDRDHFCLCNDFGSERIANCFEFDPQISYNCYKLSSCQNGGQCLQDDVHCPQTFRCICPECYYGSLCQFQSSLFDLSLDSIIGSHIQPNLSIKNQPQIIQITLVLIIILVIIGFINGILSFIAFQSKETRQVGCGYYLLGSTITTLLISIMLSIKFSILILSQLSIITNRRFLNIQCYLFDYLLQVCSNLDKWLNGCIAVERAINITKGTSFNPKKSRIIAKLIISFLIIFIISSIIYDPIHRQLVDDDSNDEQKRIWCIVSYSSKLLLLNQSIHMIHFFVPFFMNIISVVIIIILLSKQRQTIENEHQSYCHILFEQIKKHHNLLIAPFVLIILSLPRLIISFVGGCMKSNSNPMIYLIGYLISFIPPMLTFIIFVLPSKLYKEEFRKTFHKRILCFRK